VKGVIFILTLVRCMSPYLVDAQPQAIVWPALMRPRATRNMHRGMQGAVF
jgi:hypothetical protein